MRLPEARSLVPGFRYGVICPMAVTVPLLSFTRGFEPVMQAVIATFGATCCGGLVAFATGSHPIITNPSFALLMTTFLFVNVLQRLRLRAATCVTTCTWLCYADRGPGDPVRRPGGRSPWNSSSCWSPRRSGS